MLFISCNRPIKSVVLPWNSKGDQTGMNMGDVFSPQVRCCTWHMYRFHCYFTFYTRAYDIPFFLLEILWNCENSKTYRKLRTQILFCRFTNRYSSSQSYRLRLRVMWPGESESKVTQSCPTLCDPMDGSLPGSAVHGIFQARMLEWAAISFSRGSSQPRDRTRVSCIADRRFTIWATREAQMWPGRKGKCKYEQISSESI